MTIATALDIGTMIFPGPGHVPQILNSTDTRSALQKESAAECHSRENSEIARRQLPDYRLAFGTKNIVINHHRAKQRQAHDMFDDLFVEAVHTQVQHFSFFSEAD